METQKSRGRSARWVCHVSCLAACLTETHVACLTETHAPSSLLGTCIPLLCQSLALSIHQHIRPFAQIDEALTVLKLSKQRHASPPSNLRLPSPEQPSSTGRFNNSNESVWDPPSSSLISVYRNDLWVRVPSNMVSSGSLGVWC